MPLVRGMDEVVMTSEFGRLSRREDLWGCRGWVQDVVGGAEGEKKRGGGFGGEKGGRRVMKGHAGLGWG